MHSDMLWMAQAFRRYLDEKKGIFLSFSGHVHFVNDSDLMEHESRKLVFAQLTSMQTLNRENKGLFDPIIYDLNGIIGNKNATWKQKNFLFQEAFKNYMPQLPQTKVPSFLFQSDYSYEDKVILNDRRAHNTYATSDSFSNIKRSQETLAWGIIDQGKKASQNFLDSPYGCKQIKKIILDNLKADFSSWSGIN